LTGRRIDVSSPEMGARVLLVYVPCLVSVYN
jgi:hypothetical protein